MRSGVPKASALTNGVLQNYDKSNLNPRSPLNLHIIPVVPFLGYCRQKEMEVCGPFGVLSNYWKLTGGSIVRKEIIFK